jgi:serine/threonine protein phosphatase PrpC
MSTKNLLKMKQIPDGHYPYCCSCCQQTLFIGHVGDSRVYLIRDIKIEKLTIDHSLLRNG